MKTPGLSESEAQKASERTVWKPGLYPASFREAVERLARRSGNEMIEAVLTVTGPDGSEREFRDYLSGTAGLGAAN